MFLIASYAQLASDITRSGLVEPVFAGNVICDKLI